MVSAPHMPPVSGMNSAVEGLKRAGAAVEKAANDINEVAVAHQNKLSALTADKDGDAVTDSASVPTASAAGGDLAKPVVDLLAAKTAYEASLKALKVTGDVERDTAKILK